MNKAKEPEVLQPDLADLCHLWQTRLRLRDWNIEAKIVPHDEIDPGCLGQIIKVPQRRKALIKILRDKDCPECDKGHMERTLIHELIHIHFEPFWDDSKTDELEVAINMLAGAFVSET